MTPGIPHTGDTGADGQCLGLTRLPLRVQCSQLSFACSLRVTSIPVCIRRFRSSIESSAPPKGLHVEANELESKCRIWGCQEPTFSNLLGKIDEGQSIKIGLCTHYRNAIR